MSRRAALLVSFVLAWSAPTSAQSSADADLATIRTQMEQASFRDAATSLEAFLARTDLDAAHRNAALELDAVLSLARRDDARASRALAELYARDPGHRLEDPEASPVVQSAFARARESATPRTVTIETTSPDTLARHESPRIELRLADGADLVHQLRLSYRQAGTGRFAALVISPEEDGTASATLPLAADPGAQSFELFVEALAPSGHVLGSLGSADAPRTVSVPASGSVASTAEGPSTGGTPNEDGGDDLAGQWWLWTIVGVVVVGAGVGIGVGVTASQPRSPDGTLGNVTLPLLTF